MLLLFLYNFQETLILKPTKTVLEPFRCMSNLEETPKNSKAWLPYETGGAPKRKGNNERRVFRLLRNKMENVQEEKPPVLVKDLLERSVKSQMEVAHLFVDILNRLEALESGKRKRED